MRRGFDSHAHLYSASVGQKIVDILEQGSTKYGQYLPIIISKLLLECTGVHLVTYYPYLFLHFKDRIEHLQ